MKKRCQTGGPISYIENALLPRSSTSVAARPLQSLDTMTNMYNANMHKIVNPIYSSNTDINIAKANAMLELAGGDPNVLKSYYKMVVGADPEKTMPKHRKDRFREKKYGGQLISALGYRDDSPFRTASQLLIESPNISMNNVSKPLVGVSNQTGETKLMLPNGNYQFANTNSVTEFPVNTQDKSNSMQYTQRENGGTLDNLLGIAQGVGGFFGPVGAAVSGVAGLLPLVKNLFSGDDKTIVSSSPGGYATGGLTPAKARKILHDGSVRGHKLTDKQRRYFGAIASGKEDGGTIHINPENRGKFTESARRADMGVQEFASHVLSNKEDYSTTQIRRANFAKNASKWNREMGGDVPLSSTSFEVNGNPNVADSEHYKMGDTYVRLDDKEVYKEGENNGFVFSNKLKDPVTNKRFSQLAKAQELGIKNAEKQVARNPYDTFSMNTVNRNNQNLADIAMRQELSAAAQGLRNPTKSFQDGGWLNSRYPYPNSPLWNQGVTPASPEEMAKLRNAVASQLDMPIDRTPTVQTPADVMPNLLGVAETPSNVIPQVQGSSSRNQVIPTLSNAELMDNYKNNTSDPLLRAEVIRRGLLPKSKSQPSKVSPSKSLSAPAGDPLLASIENYSGPEGPYGQSIRDIYRTNMPFTAIPSKRNPMPTEVQSINRGLISPTGSTNIPLPATNAVNAGDSSSFVPGENTAYPRTPFTFGDTLQTLSALSKFGFLIGGPEKERAYTNTTPITQQVYDPTAALYQNKRAYSNALNRLASTTSPNMNRALAGSLYASNLSQQNQILSQYDRMNQEARQQYENRVGARRAENIRYGTYADQINAQNRGMYLNTVQNAFDTLSGLGQNFNQKSKSNAALAMLQESYKDVFDRYMRAINQQNLFPGNGN